jgi:flagellar biosynthesis/type III secretory pathway M-ring protein FliF/YscJ
MSEFVTYLLAAGTPLVLLIVVTIRVVQVRRKKRRRAAKRDAALEGRRDRLEPPEGSEHPDEDQ